MIFILGMQKVHGESVEGASKLCRRCTEGA